MNKKLYLRIDLPMWNYDGAQGVLVFSELEHLVDVSCEVRKYNKMPHMAGIYWPHKLARPTHPAPDHGR